MRFVPKILRKTDSFLLMRFPTVWGTRVHIIAPAGIILALLLALLAGAFPTTVTRGESWEDEIGDIYVYAALCLCVLLSIACLVFHSLDYANAPFSHGIRGFSRLWLYLVNLYSISAGPVAVALVMYFRGGLSEYMGVWPMLAAYSMLLGAGAAIVYALPSVRLLPLLGILAVVVCVSLFVALIGVATESEGAVTVSIFLIYLMFLVIAAYGRFARRNRFTLRLAIAVSLFFAPFVPVFLGFVYDVVLDIGDVSNSEVRVLCLCGIVPILVLSPLIQFLLNRVRALPN